MRPADISNPLRDEIKELNAAKQEMKSPNVETAKIESKKFAEFMPEMESLMQLTLVAGWWIRDCGDALRDLINDKKKLEHFSRHFAIRNTNS
jgi:hypothetical protein